MRSAVVVGHRPHGVDLRVEHLVHGDEVRADDVPVHVLEREVQVGEGVEAVLQQVRHLGAIRCGHAGDRELGSSGLLRGHEQVVTRRSQPSKRGDLQVRAASARWCRRSAPRPACTRAHRPTACRCPSPAPRRRTSPARATNVVVAAFAAATSWSTALTWATRASSARSGSGGTAAPSTEIGRMHGTSRSATWAPAPTRASMPSCSRARRSASHAVRAEREHGPVTVLPVEDVPCAEHDERDRGIGAASPPRPTAPASPSHISK